MKATCEIGVNPARPILGEWNVSKSILTSRSVNALSDVESQARTLQRAEEEWLEYRLPGRYPSLDNIPHRNEVKIQSDHTHRGVKRCQTP